MDHSKKLTANPKDVVEESLQSDLDRFINAFPENGFTMRLESRIGRSKKLRRQILMLAIIVGVVPISMKFPEIFLYSTHAIELLISNILAQSSFIPKNASFGLLAACLIFVSSLLITISDVFSNIHR